MRWRESMRGASLRTRIAVASALAAVLVGLVAAGVAAFLVGELEASAQDERLTDAASLMQREIDSEGGDPRHHVDDEAIEIAPTGLRMALFENGARTAGVQEVPYSDREGCTSREDATGRWRTCAVGSAARRVVVSKHRGGEKGRRGVLLVAIGGAALFSALLAALASRALAGWALGPLTALGERIETIGDRSPADADLGEPTGAAEVEALRETIRDLLRRLGEAIARSRGFAASAAHELRTPLATMMAELDLAAEETPLAPKIEGTLVRLRRTTGRLSVLVERLLMVANDGAGALVTEAVAVEDVVRDVVAGRSEAERLRLEQTFDATGMVRGDEALLRVLVDNLIDNALKYAPEGKVEILVGEGDREVRLTVRDEGPGIDPEEAERLLLPFARGHATSVPGHGLGLSIVAHAVRLHGGDLRVVERASARGAELRVTLPAWTAH